VRPPGLTQVVGAQSLSKEVMPQISLLDLPIYLSKYK